MFPNGIKTITNHRQNLEIYSCPQVTWRGFRHFLDFCQTTISSFSGYEDCLANELMEALEDCMNRRPYASLRPASKYDPRLFHVYLYPRRCDQLTFAEHQPVLTQNLHPWIDYTIQHCCMDKYPNTENVVAPPVPAENGAKQPLLRRRSRSLIKPGRPSVGSKAHAQSSEHEITQISNENSISAKNPVIVRRPSLSVLISNKPNVANAVKPAAEKENIFYPVGSYRPTQPKPSQLNVVKSTTGVFATKPNFSPRRLRSSTKDAMNTSKTGSSPMAPSASNGQLNSANSNNVNNNDKPPTMRRVSGNYMSQTIASARRLSDIKDRRRSRLGL
ncbi:hypothetical protein Ddc_03870 [Ditylenchus destructor]|nr:hypothetical protein Ddc_03870 [Ditylenchus destructor]